MKQFAVFLFLTVAFVCAKPASTQSGNQAESKQSSVPAVKPAPVHFIDIAQRAGITMQNFYGSDTHKEFIIETTGNGSVVFDYDNDGWPDIFLPNGSTVEGFPKGKDMKFSKCPASSSCIASTYKR
ncbi:MAG: hypothetical protein WA664_00855 [Candidatus Acidiferrales bacterium]